MAVAKELIRQIISENNISNIADVYPLCKESFEDIPQGIMEAELDATLGYEKNRRRIWLQIISVMDIPRKPSKASMVNFRWMSIRDIHDKIKDLLSAEMASKTIWIKV